VRPHSALADRSPEEFVRDWQQSSATPLRMAGPAEEAPADAMHGSVAADPKPLQLFGSPQGEMRGEAEKLTPDNAEQTAENSDLLEVVN
jgi:hypothetical protein